MNGIKQNGMIEYDSKTNQFDNDFVSNNKNTQIKNRSFKTPSPVFISKNNNNNNNKDEVISRKNSVKNGSNGRINNFISDVLSRRESTRSRRTSTPPFSSDFDEIDSNSNKARLHSANSQTSVTASSTRSYSNHSSPKAAPKKRSSSSFIKKLSFKFKGSSSNLPTETTELYDKKNQQTIMNNYSNKYGSTNTSTSAELERRRSMQAASTQTIDQQNTSNLNNNNNTCNNNNVNSHKESVNKEDTPKLDREAMQKVFNVFDSDHDGSITIGDVEKVMNSLQHLKNEIEMPSVEQIKIAFDKFDANKNGSIEFDEFLEILRCAASGNEDSNTSSSKSTNNYTIKATNENLTSSKPPQITNASRVKTDMRLIFEQFDKDMDGKITKHELNFVMQNLFPEEVITDRDIDEMLHAADLDKNGFIDFDEFANMFMLHSTNTAIVQTSIEPAYASSNQHHARKNTSITSLKATESLTKSNKSLARSISRSNSKEASSRSRNHSGQRSEHNSPSNYKKYVQLFTASQMMDLKAAFHMFDKNGDNKISEVELFEVMKYLGVSATEHEVKAMIQVVDKNKNGCVDYDEFIQMMTKTQLKPLSQEEELRKTFNIFDIDGNGFISHDEIKKTMLHLGENITDKEVGDMIRAADKNGDGKIDINEFSGLLNGTNVFKS